MRVPEPVQVRVPTRCWALTRSHAQTQTQERAWEWTASANPGPWRTREQASQQARLAQWERAQLHERSTRTHRPAPTHAKASVRPWVPFHSGRQPSALFAAPIRPLAPKALSPLHVGDRVPRLDRRAEPWHQP